MRTVVAWQETPVSCCSRQGALFGLPVQIHEAFASNSYARPSASQRSLLQNPWSTCARPLDFLGGLGTGLHMQPEKDGVRNVCYDLCYKPGGLKKHGLPQERAMQVISEPCCHSTLACRWHSAGGRCRQQGSCLRRSRWRFAACPERSQGLCKPRLQAPTMLRHSNE
jgi:hypothetical protein